jgi:hypothetical protein
VGAAASLPKMLMASPNLIMQLHGASWTFELFSNGSMCCSRDQPLDGSAARGGPMVTAAERCMSACNAAKILRHNVNGNAQLRQKQQNRAHLSTSVTLAGTLQPAAFPSADSCEGLAISHEAASLSLAVAAPGTNFTAFSSCITRPCRALSAFLSIAIQHDDAHWSGTVCHRRCRMRAMLQVRAAA